MNDLKIAFSASMNYFDNLSVMLVIIA